MAFLLRGAHVVDPQEGIDDVLDVLIDGEKIACVGKDLEAPADAEVIDADRRGLSPYDVSPRAVEEIRAIKARIDET